MLLLTRPSGEVFLERRPQSGIWGGLWCLPQFDSKDAALMYLSNHFETQSETLALPGIDHVFTHFDLRIEPLATTVSERASAVLEADRSLWYRLGEVEIGLPAPIKQLLSARLSPQDLFDSEIR